MTITKGIRALLEKRFKLDDDDDDDDARELLFAKMASGEITASELLEVEAFSPARQIVAEMIKEAIKSNNENEKGQAMLSNPKSTQEAFGDGSTGNGGGVVDVKSPSARYSDVRYPAKNVNTKRPVRGIGGTEVTQTSQRNMAKAGAFFLWQLSKQSGTNIVIDEHTQALVDEMVAKDAWCGTINGQYHREIEPRRVKDLLSGNTGSTLNPIWLDDELVTFPLLYGELFPEIDLVEMPRSATAHGASIGNPTVNWGQADGGSLSVFDTATLVSEIQTEIFDVTCFVRLGRFFLQDAYVPNVGSYIIKNIGMAMMHELDRVIAVGDGTSQPQGIFNAPGVQGVASQMGPGGLLTVNDLESLVFATPKQYRNKTLRPCFVSNDVMYSRARSIPVGSDDARRVFSVDDEGNYQILGYPWKVSQDIPNGQIAFSPMANYRLYRRAGQEFRQTDQGQALFLNNEILTAVIGRYGGKLMNTAGTATMTDAWD